MELEMRIVKKVAAAAMAMAVVFGAASLKPVAANAAQAGPETASVMEEENSLAIRMKLTRTSSCAV